MRALLALCASLVAVTAVAQDLNDIQLEQYWFVFLVSGENKSPMDEQTQAEGMKGHIGNLERLGKEDKCVAAGPFIDGKERRGIVVLKGEMFKTAQDVLKEFANDPFVKADRLRPQVFKWMTTKGSIHKWREPIEMKQYVFVVLDRGENRTKLSEEDGNKFQTAHLKHIFEMKDTGGLGIAGPFEGDGDMRGLLIFKDNGMEKAKKLVAQDPLIKAGRLKATFYTIYLAAGTVGD